jgi:hypothetical protein
MAEEQTAEEGQTPEKKRRTPVKYQRRVLFFMDILGWKKLIEDSEKSEDGAEALFQTSKLFGMPTLLSTKHGPQPAELESLDFQATHFSDTIAVSVPVTPEHSHAVFVALAMVHSMVGAMLGFHKYVRGAVVVGSLVHTPRVIFGPALVEAHMLEEDVAKYPRIIVTEEVRPLLAAHLPAARMLRLDRDGLWYLSPILMGMTHGAADTATAMAETRLWVTEHREADKGNLNHYAKHSWMLGFLDEVQRDLESEPKP